MITVFGSINMDLVASVTRIAAPGETVLAEGYRSFFGGKGANQAVAAARASSGAVPVAFVGVVGHDDYGALAAANLRAQDVEPRLKWSDEWATGLAFIMVDAEGENAITVVSGANCVLSDEQLPDADLADAKIVVLQMETPFEASLSIAKRAHALGVKVMWNIAPMQASFSVARIVALLTNTDYLIANEHEARQVATLLDLPAADVADIAVSLSTHHGLICVVTLGANGALACSPDGTLTVMRPPTVAVVDTTGAGDTFCGGLAAMLAEGHDLQSGLYRALVGASLSCTAAGAQTSMPNRAAIDRLAPATGTG